MVRRKSRALKGSDSGDRSGQGPVEHGGKAAGSVKAVPLDRKKLEVIKKGFGECAEIIATAPIKEKQHFQRPLSVAVLEMARRRPVTVEDVAGALDAPDHEVEEAVKALVNRGNLRRQIHFGKDYFTG